MEALCRACDIASIPAYGNDAPDVEELLMTPGQRQEMPLSQKLDNAMPYLYKNCTKKMFKEKYEWPKKDEETGLYIIPPIKTMLLKRKN